MSLTIKLHISTANLYTFQARTKGAHFSNPFTSTVYRKKRSMCSNNRNGAIRSSLIDPDGGSLVELVVPDTQRDVKTSEAESLPKVRLTQIDLEWVHVISEGWASPLKGFMRENEYLQSLHFNSLRLGDGSVVNMSLPIVLAIDDEAKEGIGSSPHVGLVGPNGDLIALLKRIKSSFCGSCCFAASYHVEPASPTSSTSSGSDDDGFHRKRLLSRSSPSSWIRSRAHHLPDRCASFFSKLGGARSGRRSSNTSEFSYDPFSYALNFEDDSADDFPVMAFSSRLPPSPPAAISRDFAACS